MKMSEAILLGSTVLAPKAGGQHFAEMKAGCALGMAAIARGCTFRPIFHVDGKERRTLGTEGVWGYWVLEEVSRPCRCWRVLVPRKMRIKDIIAHLFDHHVMGKKNWTLEQLVAWVETVEPNNTAPPSRERTVHPSEVISIYSEFTRQQLLATQAHEEEEEDEEWQAARQAFTAKYDANRRRERPVTR